MTPSPRDFLLAGVLSATALLAPAAAQATTVCVNNPAGCSGTNVTSANLESGAFQGAPFNDGVADEIVLAPGTYTESADGTYTVNGGNDQVVIRGAGPGETILTSAGTGNQYVMTLSSNPNFTVRDLTVAVPASFPNGPGYGAALLDVGADLDKVTITSANEGSTGVNAQGSFAVTGADFSTPGGTAIDTAGAGSVATITGSVFAGKVGVSSSLAAQTTVRRATVSGTSSMVTGASSALSNSGATLVVSDTLVKLTSVGANVATGVGAASGAQPATTTGDHLTIVEVSGTSTQGVSNFVHAAVTMHSQLTLSNPIIRGVDTSGTTTSPAGGGMPVTMLRNSNSPPLLAPAGDGVVTQGNNQNADPKFVSPATGDYRLAATSPSIDVANPTWTSSTTDRDGAARTQDGDANGTAIPDQGAYERAGVAAPPQDPPPADPQPDPQPTPDPISQPGPDATPSPKPNPLPPVQPAKTCTVPALKALTLAKAQRALTKAGCKVGKVVKPKLKLKKGTRKPTLVVRKQGTKAGRKVARGTRVKLTLQVKPAAKKPVKPKS